MTDLGKMINELTFQLHSKEVVEHHDPIQLSVTDANKILELLKKQETKPVKVTKNEYNYEFYHCPNCGRGFFEPTYYNRPAYCDQCGQRLKWND